MKTQGFILFILSLLFSFTGQGQIFKEDFEGVKCTSGVGSVPDTWLMYNDNNEPHQSLSKYGFAAAAWKIESDGENQYALAPSFFKSPAQADRWLVSPEIDLGSAASPHMVCVTRSLDKVTRDGFVIKVSTTGKEKSAFTKELGKVLQEKEDWTQHVYDLSEYKGKKIHLAWIQNTTDKYMLALDDILIQDVKESVNASIEFTMPEVVLSTQRIPMVAKFQNFGASEIKSAIVNYTINGSAPRSTTLNDLSIKTLEAIKIGGEMWAPSSEGGKTVTVEFWVSNINGGNVSSNKISQLVTVVEESGLPQKNALFEGFSSATCGPCANANRYLHEIFPGLNVNKPESGFYVVKFQVDIPSTGDPAVTAETKARSRDYDVISAPTFFIGGKKIAYWNYIDTLMTAIKAEQSQKSTIMLHNQSILKDNTFKINVNIHTFFPTKDVCKLYVVILEDSIHHEGAGNGEVDFFYIARKMLPSVSGTVVDLSKIGETKSFEYEYTFDMKDPLVFNGTENMTVLAYVQNTKTMEILQVKLGETAEYNSKESDKARNFKDLYIVPNPSPSERQAQVSFTLIQNANLTMEIFDMSGRKLWQSQKGYYQSGSYTKELPIGFKTGMYFVRVKADTGVGSTIKWIVK